MPRSTRFTIGRSGDSLSDFQVSGSMPSTNRLGSNPGLGDQRQHPAGVGVERHQPAEVIAERMLGHRLQFRVEMQAQILARHRRNPRQHAHRAAAGVGLHLVEAGAAVQQGFVALLQPGLADMDAALVVLLAAVFAQLFQVAVVDAADKAQHVRHAGPGLVIAEQPRLHFHPRQAIAVGGENRHLLVGQLAFQRHGFELVRFGTAGGENAATAPA